MLSLRLDFKPRHSFFQDAPAVGVSVPATATQCLLVSPSRIQFISYEQGYTIAASKVEATHQQGVRDDTNVRGGETAERLHIGCILSQHDEI